MVEAVLESECAGARARSSSTLATTTVSCDRHSCAGRQLSINKGLRYISSRIQDCFSSSATISHAEGGFSQRTHGSGRVSSKKVSSLEKSRDLQASKDAYMLVYQRRLPSDAMDVERSEAPAYVRKDIERRNLAWSTACQLWELKCVSSLQQD